MKDVVLLFVVRDEKEPFGVIFSALCFANEEWLRTISKMATTVLRWTSEEVEKKLSILVLTQLSLWIRDAW